MKGREINFCRVYVFFFFFLRFKNIITCRGDLWDNHHWTQLGFGLSTDFRPEPMDTRVFMNLITTMRTVQDIPDRGRRVLFVVTDSIDDSRRVPVELICRGESLLEAISVDFIDNVYGSAFYFPVGFFVGSDESSQLKNLMTTGEAVELFRSKISGPF